MNAVVRGGRAARVETRGHVQTSYASQTPAARSPRRKSERQARPRLAERAARPTASSLALAPSGPSGHHGAVTHHALGRSRLAWLDRFIVPRETPLAPSRWHQHIAQRRISRVDHLRPHRLNWEALKQPDRTIADSADTDEAL